MGNRAVQAGLVVVFLVFGVFAAYALNGGRKSGGGGTANASPSVASTPSASPTEAASPSPSASVAPTAAPSEAPTQTPTAAPTQSSAPTGTGTGSGTASSGCSTSGTGGSGPYPQQLDAGATYQYCGPRALVAHATDSGESGSSVCAGINESTQDFPSGYRGVFFVGVVFKDGQIVSSGYIRTSGARQDFGSIANGAGQPEDGALGGDPGPGSHTYCVTHVAAGWQMTRDGSVLFTTTREPASNFSGATLKFDSDVETTGSPAGQQFTFTIPGFHDINVDGSAVPASRFRGATFYA